MKLVLKEALHARPANMLVRLASQHVARVELRKGVCRADAAKILDVLALGAVTGDEIEVVSEGDGGAEALAAIAELVTRNFDADLVPETGSSAVAGIAIGRALVVTTPEPGAAAPRGEGGRALMLQAGVVALAELDALIETLAAHERELFEPERAIVGDIVQRACERVEGGEAPEEAVLAVTRIAATDLIEDARERILGALAGGIETGDLLARAESLGDEVVVVTQALTPSLVARMPPRVRGIVAVDDTPGRGAGGVRTSHAAILARGRELAVAFVPPHVAASIADGDVVVVDAAGATARVWVEPSEALIADARARRAKGGGAGAAELARSIEAVSVALGIALQVNVGSTLDRIPEGAAGVGLLRTELVFAGHTRAPSETEQTAALLAVARAARGSVVTVRLWDAGGDKPLPWLPPVHEGSRGAALLFERPQVLTNQLAAIARASDRARLRVLIPMTRSSDDVHRVRAILDRHRVGVAVGAMIETPEAARDADGIARAADFVCVGTNDLAALVLGTERSDAAQSLHPDVLALVDKVVASAHACGRLVSICGEVAADPRGAPVLVGLGVDALSVAPPRLTAAVAALAGRTLDDCRVEARQLMKESP